MTPEELNVAKHSLELRKFRFDRAKIKREQHYLFRNSAVLITASVSLATVAVSIATVLNTRQATIQNLDFQVEETKRKSRFEEEATKRAGVEIDRKASLEMLQYITTNYDLIYSGKSEKQIRIRNAMQLAFPRAALERAFEQLAKTAPTTDAPSVWQEEQRTADQATLTEPLRRPIGGGTAPPLPTTKEELIAALTGKDRRLYAERLSNLEGQAVSGAVELLTGSLLSQSDRWSYRFNLYVAYTLAKFPGGWIGSPAQLASIDALKRTGNYRDATFKQWVDAATRNHKRAGA